MDTVEIIRDYYDSEVLGEWGRIGGRPEFILTCRFIDRYVRQGEKVLDVGGGPGRYSLYLATKGCDVTLFDLAPANVQFAKERATEQGVSFNTIVGDVREIGNIVSEKYDHILLMGPMYHLLEEADRVKAITACLKLLKPNGIIFISFINMIAGMIYAMKYKPEMIIDPIEKLFYDTVLENKSYSGMAFTHAYFAKQSEILPFMEQFPLEKLHFLGQEGITSPCESNIMSQPPEVVNAWLDFSEKICEREDLLSYSEHLMYIGRYTM